MTTFLCYAIAFSITQTPPETIHGQDRIRCFSFLPDGKLFFQDRRGRCEQWSLDKEPKKISTTQHPGALLRVANNKCVFLEQQRLTFGLISAEIKKVGGAIDNETGKRPLCFSENGQYCILKSPTGKGIQVVDLKKEAPVAVPDIAQEIWSASISNDGEVVVVINKASRVALWTKETAKWRALEKRDDMEPQMVAPVKNRKAIMVGNGAGRFMLFSVRDLGWIDQVNIDDYDFEPGSCQFFNEGKFLVAGGRKLHFIRVHDWSVSEVRAPERTRKEAIRQLEISLTGKMGVMSWEADAIEIYDIPKKLLTE